MNSGTQTFIVFTENAILKKKKLTLKKVVGKIPIHGDIESLTGCDDHTKAFSLVHKELKRGSHPSRIIHIETSDLSKLTSRMPIGTFPKHEIFRNSYTEGYVILKPKIVSAQKKPPSGVLHFLASLIK